MPVIKNAGKSALYKLGLSLIITALILLTGCGRDSDEAMEFKLTFVDEFDGQAGESMDTTVWKYDVGTGWGNNQLEYDTDSTSNVYKDGAGHLAITAREESYKNCDYTSGRITTSGSFEQAYGRFEARIKLPVGAGIWPAFWMLGNDIDIVKWPQCGEIDIMEYRGQEPDILFGALHGPGYSAGSAISRRYDLDGLELYRDFHTFTIDWSPAKITWMLDGETYHTVTPEDLPTGTKWVFDHPFFIILNVAVGGTFVGDPDQDTVFPQTMLIDWVRVYSLQASGRITEASAVEKKD